MIDRRLPRNQLEFRTRSNSAVSVLRLNDIRSFNPAFSNVISISSALMAAGKCVFAFGFILIGLTLVLASVNSIYLSNRIVWNTFIAGNDVGGMTRSEAKQFLESKIRDLYKQKIYLRNRFSLYPIRLETIAAFDVEGTVDKVYQRGHQSGFFENEQSQLTSYIDSKNEMIRYVINETAFYNAVNQAIPELRDNQPVDAGVVYNGDRFEITEGNDGLGFERDFATRQLRALISDLQGGEITIMVHKKNADIDSEKAAAAQHTASIMLRSDLKMQYTYDGYNYDRWGLNLSQIRQWINFKKVIENGTSKLYPILDEAKLRKYLAEKIAPYMYTPKQDITVMSEDGAPKIQGTLRNGYCLDIENSVQSINRAWQHGKDPSSGCYLADLTVSHIEGSILNPDNEFGLSDVLSVGVTDFFGSSINRKHNIQHVSDRIQNVFLEAGELFSFVKKMGPIDSLSGYRKELVIVNGDSTEPQYGGGVCQVSSTLFRAIFFAGLKVVNRKSHSFEVAYYKPAGLDATVFDPAPDLAFVNDMPSSIFIQNYVDMKKTKVYFFIIGKKDGRKLSFDGPIYGGTMGKHYQYSWTRDIQMADGSRHTEEFVSIYKDKNAIKKYRPEPAKTENLAVLH
ncbi:VanW family protein [bacterium]|nr:VanW family protein [bacterium]